MKFSLGFALTCLLSGAVSAFANFTGAPAINYDMFTRASGVANKSFDVLITDATGVKSGVLGPRVYYRKNAYANYVSNSCPLTSGTAQAGHYQCTINYALMTGGVNVGDRVQYFVIAQSINGSVNSEPDGTVATDVNTISVATPTPRAFDIARTFGGPIDVGAGKSIRSLTNDGGLFEQLNNGIIAANVIVSITSDLAGESGKHPLRQLEEDGTGNWTIYVAPTGGARTVNGTSAFPLIRIEGADRVTFDGNPFGLTFKNPSNNAILFEISRGSLNSSVLNCSFN